MTSRRQFKLGSQKAGAKDFPIFTVVLLELLASSCICLRSPLYSCDENSQLDCSYWMKDSSYPSDLPSNGRNKEQCVPCSSMDSSHLLSREDVDDLLREEQLVLWEVRENPPHTRVLVRTFTAQHFQAALDAIHAFGRIAEVEGHHPDLHLTDYRKVEIVIFTHKLGGITRNDIRLARLLDQVKVSYSPQWLTANPHATFTSSSIL